MPATQHDESKNSNLIALVVEGGGMRGVYSAGVLDAFHHTGFNPFSIYVGVSAGAMNLLSFLAGQPERNKKVYQYCAESSEFISLKRFLFGGHLLDLDWMWENTIKEFPLNQEALFQFTQDHRRFVVVCSDLNKGESVNFEPAPENLRNVVTASSAVPVFYRKQIEINERTLVDGGATDPIPVKTAYELGARHIVVIRSRDIQYRKSFGIEAKFARYWYRDNAKAREMFESQHKAYNDSIEFIQNPPSDVNIIQIASEKPLNAGRTTTNWGALERDYKAGYDKGIDIVQLLAKALEQKVKDMTKLAKQFTS